MIYFRFSLAMCFAACMFFLSCGTHHRLNKHVNCSWKTMSNSYTDMCAIDENTPSFPVLWLLSHDKNVEGLKIDSKTQIHLATCGDLNVYVTWTETVCSHGPCIKSLYRIVGDQGNEIDEFGKGFGCVSQGVVILSALNSFDANIAVLIKQSKDHSLTREETLMDEDAYSLRYINGVNYAVRLSKISIMKNSWPPEFEDIYRNKGSIGSGFISKQENLICVSEICGLSCVDVKEKLRFKRFASKDACSPSSWLVVK
jgi:hypothetical protein